MSVDLLDDTASIRLRRADEARLAPDVSNFPRLAFWNYDPCAKHAPERKLGCRECGIDFRRHQRVGIPWLYLIEKGLLADTVGSGKTVHAAALLALMKERGELRTDNRALIIVRPAALMQWTARLHQYVPKLLVAPAMGTRAQRIQRYSAAWEVGLIGYQMLLRDADLLEEHFQFGTVIVDDVDPLRHRETQTAYRVKRLCYDARRVVIMTGTPLQKKLHELHSVFEPIGGRAFLGSEQSFYREYVDEGYRKEYNRATGRTVKIKVVHGYKNVDKFKSLIAPYALRRTSADIDDADMPTIQPNTVELDLYPAQRKKYDELRRGVLKIIREEGIEVKQTTAASKFLYGAKVCGGLATLGEEDGPGASVKLDWCVDKITGDLEDEKVVVFGYFRATCHTLAARLEAEGVGAVTITSDDNSKVRRQTAIDAFWNDPKCRVLIGTTAIEQSIDLHVARHMINVDLILNPARMEQLAGRIRRDGSAHQTVYIHNLVCFDTQEERYMDALEREQALIDYVWDEESELFETLSPLAMMQLITG